MLTVDHTFITFLTLSRPTCAHQNMCVWFVLWWSRCCSSTTGRAIAVMYHHHNLHFLPWSTSPSLWGGEGRERERENNFWFFHSTVVDYLFQKQVYRIVQYAFQHWPLNESFRMVCSNIFILGYLHISLSLSLPQVVELWLTYIQPWRYTETTPTTEAKQVDKRWKPYILENFPFYSSLLVKFFQRSFQLDLTSDLGVSVLLRVTKVIL